MEVRDYEGGTSLLPSLAGPMEKKQRDDAVYVTGLPDDVTTDKLSELFGSIGVIKVSCLEGMSCVPVNMLRAVLFCRITAGPTPLWSTCTMTRWPESLRYSCLAGQWVDASHLVKPVCLYLSSVEYQLTDAICLLRVKQWLPMKIHKLPRQQLTGSTVSFVAGTCPSVTVDSQALH